MTLGINSKYYPEAFGGLTSGYSNSQKLGQHSEGNSFPKLGAGNGSVTGVDHGLFAGKTSAPASSSVNPSDDLVHRIGRINGEISPVMQNDSLANRLDFMA